MIRYSPLALALVLATAVAAQDGSIVQSGFEHNAAKAAYSLAAFGALRELGVAPALAVPLSTVGLWTAGIALERAKGHRQPALDKVHDLAIHSIVVVPLSLRRKPRLAIGSLLAAALTIAVTCARANPRSC